MLKRTLVLTGIFLASAVFIARADRSEPTPIRRQFATFPMQLGEWRGRQEPPFDDKVLAILGVDDYVTRAYFSSGAGVGLYVGYWHSQRQGEAIHSPLNCLPGAGWEPLSKGTIAIDVADTPGSATSRRITVNRYVIQKGLERQLVLYWYQSHGRVIASEYMSKLYLVADAVRLNRTDAALVRVIVPVRHGDGADAASERDAVQFVRSVFPVLSDYLPQ